MGVYETIDGPIPGDGFFFFLPITDAAVSANLPIALPAPPGVVLAATLIGATAAARVALAPNLAAPIVALWVVFAALTPILIGDSAAFLRNEPNPMFYFPSVIEAQSTDR